jgi:hypothetical protein
MTRIILALVPALACASTVRAQGLSLSPSFGISEVYDDNLFNRPAGEADTITRASSRLDAQYRSGRQLFSARYALDADRFASHPELTSAHARQDAGFEEQYQATRRLSLGGAASFTETETPADLNLDTALTPGRARAQRVMLHPSARYEFGPLLTATIGYTAAHDDMFGVSLLTQTTAVSVERHPSARDGVRWEYSHQNYLFDAIERKTSQAATAEWTRDLTRATSLSLRGGPRVTDRRLSPDLAASLRHKMQIGDATLSYAHSQTTLVGLVGIADTHSLTARVSGELRSGGQLRIEPGVLRTTQQDLASAVYRLSVGCVQPVGRRAAIELSYDVNVQHGNIYAAQRMETIGRHVVRLSLVTAAAGSARR